MISSYRDKENAVLATADLSRGPCAEIPKGLNTLKDPYKAEFHQ